MINGSVRGVDSATLWENFHKMLRYLKRRFWRPRRESGQFDPTGLQLENCSVGQLQGELEDLTIKVLQKAGVNPACVTVSVEHAGTLQDHRPLLRSMVAFTQWDADCAYRLLLGLPHIERALRRALEGSWVSDASHFGGVWLHPSAATSNSSALKHLGAALNSLEGFKSGDSIWTGESVSGSSLRGAADR